MFDLISGEFAPYSGTESGLQRPLTKNQNEEKEREMRYEENFHSSEIMLQ